MFKRLFVFLNQLWVWIQPCELNERGEPVPQSSSLKKIPDTTYLVKEYVIVLKGVTHAWWEIRGALTHRLYKIVYHTGDTVYFNSFGNKVIYVVDAKGKRWG